MVVNVSVLIPYRSDNGGPRDEIFAFVQDRLRTRFFGFDVRFGFNDEEPFNRGAARNDAFEHATGDYLVIADADTLFTRGQILEALELIALENIPWVLPFDVYYNATERDTQRLLKNFRPGEESWFRRPSEWDHRLTDSVAGCLVMSREAFETVGGYDTRFSGWGGEDRAFAYAVDTLWGPCMRMENEFIVHLWHPRGDADFAQPDWPKNERLLRRYERAYGNPEAMRSLVDEGQRGRVGAARRSSGGGDRGPRPSGDRG